MAPRNAAVLGGLASVLGLVGIGCAVFGPATYSYGTNWLRAGPSSLWDQGLTTTSVLLYLGVMIVAALGIGAGVSLRSQRGGPATLIVLWTGTVVFLGGGLLTLPGNTTATASAWACTCLGQPWSLSPPPSWSRWSIARPSVGRAERPCSSVTKGDHSPPQSALGAPRRRRDAIRVGLRSPGDALATDLVGHLVDRGPPSDACGRMWAEAVSGPPSAGLATSAESMTWARRAFSGHPVGPSCSRAS